MAKKYKSKNEIYEVTTTSQSNLLGVIVAILFVIMLTLVGSMDNIIEKWTGLLSACVIMFFLFTSSPVFKAKYLSPLFLSFTAYVVWGGISTFYAASGKFAIFEFSKLLFALCVYLAILFFSIASEDSFRKVSYVLASAGCFYGIISIDAASSNVLTKPFKAFVGIFTEAFANNGAFEQGIRITGIFGNPNIYAGFMAIAVLLSLYLVIRANNRKNAMIATVLLAINSLSYLLAFSMGSLFMFLLACLVMIGMEEKGSRVAIFILMVETAILTFVFAFIAMAGLGKTGGVSFLPILALVLNVLFLYQIDGRVRPYINKKLTAHTRLLPVIILTTVILISVYVLAAFQISSEMQLKANESVTRAIYVPSGEYTLVVQSSQPVNVRIDSQNKYDLMRRTSVNLYSGTNASAVNFIVPKDSKIIQISFISFNDKVKLSSAYYKGTEQGKIHLNYPLLPNFIANRIQNLFANENAVQRTIFFEDGIKLFYKSPIIGRGLGGFENGIYAVQDFNYETKYAHNHYIQVLSDLGVIGLILFLAILAFSILSIAGSKRQKRSIYAIPALSACLVQVFGQAGTDATWSAGVSLGFAAAILALITTHCSDPIKLKDAQKEKHLKFSTNILLALFSGVFILLLSGNLYAQAQAKHGVESFKDIQRMIFLDRFEYNDYKVSYLVNAPKSDDPAVLAQAYTYAQELMKVESNSIAPYVMSYNFKTHLDADAFNMAKYGIQNAKASPYMWSRIFDILEEYIDPVGPYTNDAADRLKEPEYYIGSVLKLYDALLERNSSALDQLTLSPYNDTFIGKLLMIRDSHLYSTDWVFTVIMSYAFDSESAVDANLDGIPDRLSLVSGRIQRNQDRLLTVTDNTVIDLTLCHKLHGKYTFKIKADAPQGIKIALNGSDQNVLYTEKEAYIELDLADNSEMTLSKFTVTFPAATVIDAITYTTKLE